MTGSVRRCYEMAKKDEVFNIEMRQHDEKFKVPGFFSDELGKILYATVYFGWLVGRCRYEGEIKSYLTELDGK